MIRRQILFLNLLLLAVTSALAYQLVTDWEEFESRHQLERVVALSQQEVAPQDVSALESARTRELSHDFFVIAERDLFSPERRLEAEESGEAEVLQAPQFPQRPQMQGAAVINGEEQAFVTIFPSSAARTQGESRTVEVGDDVQGYTVTDITETTVTLRWNDVVEIIDMMDAEPVQQAPAAQSMAAVNIIKIGSRHAAVETTTSSVEEPAEGQGLQVGVVGGQTNTQLGGGAMQGRGMGPNGRMSGQSGAGRMGGRSQGMRGGMSGAGMVGGQTPSRRIPQR